MMHRNYESIKQKFLQYIGSLVNLMLMTLLFALVIAIIKETYSLFTIHLFHDNPQLAIAQILFIMIHIELISILVVYFSEGKMMVQKVVELGIISIVREMMLTAFQITTEKLFAISAFLLVLGIVFFLERYFSDKK